VTDANLQWVDNRDPRTIGQEILQLVERSSVPVLRAADQVLDRMPRPGVLRAADRPESNGATPRPDQP
jgi:hypothetical protein